METEIKVTRVYRLQMDAPEIVIDVADETLLTWNAYEGLRNYEPHDSDSKEPVKPHLEGLSTSEVDQIVLACCKLHIVMEEERVRYEANPS